MRLLAELLIPIKAKKTIVKNNLSLCQKKEIAIAIIQKTEIKIVVLKNANTPNVLELPYSKKDIQSMG